MKYVCENCGKEFRRAPSKVRKYKKHFCSKECVSKFRKRTKYGIKSGHQFVRGVINSK